MISGDDITFDHLLYRTWVLHHRNRVRRAMGTWFIFSLAIMAATAGLIEVYFRVAR